LVDSGFHGLIFAKRPEKEKALALLFPYSLNTLHLFITYNIHH